MKNGSLLFTTGLAAASARDQVQAQKASLEEARNLRSAIEELAQQQRETNKHLIYLIRQLRGENQ